VKIRVVWIGKTRDANLTRLIADYSTRIAHFLPVDIVELKDPKRRDMEGGRILAALDASERVVILDPAGKSRNSEEFAALVARHMREDPRSLTFVIGGYSGLSLDVKKRADLTLSLSPLTFTHDLSRVLLLEQIYRALSIIHHHPYSK
jgi:23S rRNA (pseudouridine1915-N3)-methyltransferase